MPRKMVKVQSVLESLRIRIVRDNGKCVEGENKSTLSTDKIYFRRKRKNDSGTRGEDYIWVLVVSGCFCLHEDLKLEYKRIRF